ITDIALQRFLLALGLLAAIPTLSGAAVSTTATISAVTISAKVPSPFQPQTGTCEILPSNLEDPSQSLARIVEVADRVTSTLLNLEAAIKDLSSTATLSELTVNQITAVLRTHETALLALREEHFAIKRTLPLEDTSVTGT